MKQTATVELAGGKILHLETGQLAKQAQGSAIRASLQSSARTREPANNEHSARQTTEIPSAFIL